MDDNTHKKSGGLLVLGKITAILDAFTLTDPTLTLADLRDRTGLPASTVQRLVANLVDQGFLDKNDAGYRVGVRMAHWAAPALQGAELVDTARPVLEALRDRTGETAALFRESRGYRVCVALAETHKVVRSAMRVGLVLPLHVGSAGHVLLAWDPVLREEFTQRANHPGGLTAMTKATVTDLAALNDVVDETAERGYAISSGERELGAGGVSAPVFSPQGTLLAALNLLGPNTRLTPERYEDIIPVLLEAAERLTRSLGGRRPGE